MSQPVIVKGNTLDELITKLELIRAHILYRKSLGWDEFQSDENWEYNSLHDRRVCPICAEFDKIHKYSGTDIPKNFPSRQWRIELETVYPNVHVDYPKSHGDCRCRLDWLDADGTLANRLAGEFATLVI